MKNISKNDIVTDMEQASRDILDINQDLFRIDMLTEPNQADLNRYEELKNKRDDLSYAMQKTHKHNIQQLKLCTLYIATLEHGSADYQWALNRKAYLKKQIDIYRASSRRGF